MFSQWHIVFEHEDCCFVINALLQFFHRERQSHFLVILPSVGFALRNDCLSGGQSPIKRVINNTEAAKSLHITWSYLQCCERDLADAASPNWTRRDSFPSLQYLISHLQLARHSL
jgi:hypothetical protein